MRSKNGTSKFLFVFIVFLGTSFSAVDGATTPSFDATEAATTEAGPGSATDATGTSVVTGDTETQATGDTSASAGGTEQTQESATAVTSNPVNDSQSTQEQTSPGTGPSGSADSQEQTTGGTGPSVSNASPEQTSQGTGPSGSSASQEQTTGETGPSVSAASPKQTTDEETTGTGKALAPSDGTTNSASLEVTTTEDALTITSVEGHSTEAPKRADSEDGAGSTGQTTTEEPKGTSMTSSDSTKATATEADSLNDTSIENTKTAQSRQPDHLIGMAIASVPVAAAVLVLAGIGLASLSHSLFSNASATSPNKERIMLESGGPGEPDGASNPIPDAQIVGDEGPVPVGAPAAPNSGGQPISNPAGDVENTKL